MPRPDHFIGYTVEQVKRPALVLEGGWKFIDKGAQWDKGLVGQRLVSIEENEETVRLLFNQGEASVTKGNLMLFNPIDESLFDPYAPVDPNADLPPDPSTERITEGPTDEEVRRELDASTNEETGTTE